MNNEDKPNIGTLILERVNSRTTALFEEAKNNGFPGYPSIMDRMTVATLVSFEAQAMAFSEQTAMLWLALGESRGFTPDGTAIWVKSVQDSLKGGSSG